jgi:hypothetical protein
VETPPTGYDALLRLDRLPLLADWPAFQDSSYSRRNDNSDEGNFLRVEKDGEQVLVDADGPGVVYRVWSTGVVGRQTSDRCRFRFWFDGEDRPRIDLPARELFGGRGCKYPFVPPLSVTFESGAPGNPAEGPCNLCYVPIPFSKHLKVTGREISFYHVDYLKIDAGAALPSWSPEWAASQKDKHEKAAALFKAVGHDPKPADPDAVTAEARATIEPGKALRLPVDFGGPGVLDAVRLKLAAPTPRVLRGLVLRITFDGAAGPSVLAPAGDFFGSGGGDRRFRSLICGMTADGYYSFWPMPFTRKALVELANDTDTPLEVERFAVTGHPDRGRADNAGFFHARYVQDPNCAPAKDYTALELKGHKGKFVGINCTMQNAGSSRGIFFLEGDEKIYCDGEKWPSRWLGTGTEDYYNGAYFWNHPDKAAMARPLGGLTFLDWGIGRVCAYRWHLTDWISFRDSIRVDQEHGPVSDIATNYQSVAYYYLDSATAQPPLPELKDRALVTTLPPAPLWLGCGLEGTPLFKGKPVVRRPFHDADPAVVGDDGQYFAATIPSEALEVRVAVPGEEKYHGALFLSGGPDYGVVDVVLDGAKVAAFNAYRPEFHPWLEVPLGEHRLAGGTHRLHLQARAKDAAGKAAHLALVAVQLRPTSPMVRTWSSIGTWPCPRQGGWKVPHPPETEQDLEATYEVPGQGKLAWKAVDSETVPFAGDYRVGYGLTYVWSPDERKAACFLGRDDSLKVWVNDAVVFDVWGFSHMIPDSSFCAVKLRKGWNKVLVKNANWSGGFGYCVRFGDPDRVLKYARKPD